MVELKRISNVINQKVPAYTLFESVVAITIITVLIGLGTLIYSNIIDAENPILYYQAEEQVKQKKQELYNSQAFFSQSFEYDNYTIDQLVTKHNGNKNLYAVTFTVLLGNEELLKRKHLMVNKQNEY